MLQEKIDYLRSQLIRKVMAEFNEAAIDDSLEVIIEKYGLYDKEIEMVIVSPRTAKILVFGASAVNKNDLEKVCKRLGIASNRIEFLDDYSKMSGFSVETLRNSLEYSDILIGPIPHKIKDLGNSTSLLSKMQQKPDEYPRVIPLYVNGELKITRSSFEKGLKQTRLYESINN